MSCLNRMKWEILGVDKIHSGSIAVEVSGDDEVSWRELHPDSSSLPTGRKRLRSVLGGKARRDAAWRDAALALTTAGGRTNGEFFASFVLQNGTWSDGFDLAERRAGTPVSSPGDRLGVGCTQPAGAGESLCVLYQGKR